MSAHQAAVLGFGQTKYKTSRSDAGTPELVYEAVSRAVADADVEMTEIDAIVFASAPEVFEGVYEPERWCVEAFTGVGKPLLRVHTGGATGGSGPIAAAHLISSGIFETVLVVSGGGIGLENTFATVVDVA